MNKQSIEENKQPIEAKESTAGASGLGDSRYSGLGNGGYDVQHYTLDFNVKDVESSNLEATTTIEAQATQDLTSFNLDFTGFEIASIMVNGQPAEFSRDGQELNINPTHALHQGDNFAVEVAYSGSPEPAQSLSFSEDNIPVGWNPFVDGSYVLSEPNGSEHYYPVNNHPLDKASYTFRVTTPKPYEAAANGVLEKTIDNGDTNTYVFEASEPMASYLSTINIYKGFNTTTETSANGVPIRNYFAEDIPEAQLEPFKLQPEMIDYFSEIFGSYPFETYGSVVLDTPMVVNALETQTLSVFGAEALANPELESTIAHELAHQWFGNSLSLTDWGDIWLNESFATYAEGLWIEERQGAEALDTWVDDQFLITAVTFDNSVVPGEPPADNLFQNRSVYDWSSIGLHALRQEIGDEAFFNSLQTYNENFQGGNVTPEDFIHIAEEASGQELDPFFDRWFYNQELASLPEEGLFAGTVGDEVIAGNDQNEIEVLAGLDGHDTLLGNSGTNFMVGNSGDDLLDGGGIENTFYGGSGNDIIFANGQSNTILGGDLTADTGNDTIWLGKGSINQIVLAPGEGHDTINNYQLGSTTFLGTDKEQLSFVDSAEGVQIIQGEDLLAVATGQSADVFTSNVDTIFV